METTIDLAIKFVSSTQGSESGLSESGLLGLPISSTGDLLMLVVILLAIFTLASGIFLFRAWKKSAINVHNNVTFDLAINLSPNKKPLLSSNKTIFLVVAVFVAFLLSVLAFCFNATNSAQALQDASFKGSDVIGYVDEETGNVTFSDGAITNIGDEDAIVTQVTTKRPVDIDDGDCYWTLKSGDVGIFNGITSIQGITNYLEQELNVLSDSSIPLSVNVNGLSIDKAKSLIDKNVVSFSFKLKEAEPQVKVTGVELDQSTLSLQVGESAKLKATVLPDEASDKRVLWSSSNEAVATVDSDGNVLAKGSGRANIIAKTVEGGFSDTCFVSVIEPVPIIEISLPTKAGDLTYNGKEQLGVIYDSQFSKYFTIVGDSSAINAGDYSATFILNDKTTTKWADNTTDDKTINWSIEKAISTLKLDTSYATYTVPTLGTFKYKYDGDGAITMINIQPEYCEASMDAYNCCVNINPIKKGKSVIELKALEGNNYKATSAKHTATINNGTIEIATHPAGNLTYTGSPQNLGCVTATPNDCKIEYKLSESESWSTIEPSAIDVATYTVDYRVTKTGYNEASGLFSTKINFAKVDVPQPETGLVYNGKEQTGVKLSEGETRYTLKNNTGINTSSYSATATLTDKKNYVWNVDKPSAEDITIKWSIGKATPIITNLVCDDITFGEIPSPKASVDFGTITYLYANSERRTYGNWSTTNPSGTYWVKACVAQSDNWEASDSEPSSFTVNQKSITKCIIDDIDATTYTGQNIESQLTIKDGNNTLIKDTNYKVSYSNNVNAGTALVTVTGIGNYKDTYDKTFTINKAQNPMTFVLDPNYFNSEYSDTDNVLADIKGVNNIPYGYKVTYTLDPASPGFDIPNKDKNVLQCNKGTTDGSYNLNIKATCSYYDTSKPQNWETSDITQKAEWTVKTSSNYKPIYDYIDDNYVVFLPAYNGDTCPYNFYIKSGNLYTKINNIGNMADLGSKIKSAGAEKIYTDATNTTFYGTMEGTWDNSFKGASSGGLAEGLSDHFKLILLGSGIKTVYFENNDDKIPTSIGNWDKQQASEPKLGSVDYNSYFNAYKDSELIVVLCPWSSCSCNSNLAYYWSTALQHWHTTTRHYEGVCAIVLTLPL